MLNVIFDDVKEAIYNSAPLLLEIADSLKKDVTVTAKENVSH